MSHLDGRGFIEIALKIRNKTAADLRVALAKFDCHTSHCNIESAAIAAIDKVIDEAAEKAELVVSSTKGAAFLLPRIINGSATQEAGEHE